MSETHLLVFAILSFVVIHSIGRNIVHLVDRQDEPYCFRLHRDRVYYVR